MSEDDGRPDRDTGRDSGGDVSGGFGRGSSDEPIDLRALFGTDFDALDADGAAVPDISAEDAAFVRSVLSADLDDVPAGPAAAQIVAAARAAHPGPVRGRPEPDSELVRQARGADIERDELAARRRRRWNRGLLAAAGVAAVLVVAVPIALNAGGGSAESAGASMAVAAPSAAASAGDAAASTMAGQRSAGSDAAADASSASAEDRASAGEPNRAPAPGPGSTSAAAAGSAGSAASPTTAAGSAAVSAARTVPAPIAPIVPGRPAASQAPSTAAENGSCTWTELPAGATDLARSSFGGVVGAPRPLATDCAATRVSGGTFPAADGSRGGVTVEVQTVVPVATGSSAGSAAASPPCTPEGCRPDGSDTVYAATDANTRTVWLYANGQQIRVSASAGLQIDDAALATFARGLADLVR